MRSFSARFSALHAQLPAGVALTPTQRLSLCWLADEARSGPEHSLISRLQRLSLPAGARHIPTAEQRRLAERLLAGEKLRLAFINDNGFYAGAGIATARQARSFALAGHQVSVVSLNPSPETALSCQFYRNWLQGSGGGAPIQVHAAPGHGLHRSRNGSNDLRAFVAALQQQESWDLVVLGNLHATALSLGWLLDLLAQALPVLWFAHDLDLLGGGCGYPQNHQCDQHRSGCFDSLCPKPANAYPQSSAGRIQHNYLLRSLLFALPGLGLATHSRWCAQQLQARFPQQPLLQLPLGLDTEVFQPLASAKRAAQRQSLGLQQDHFTVVIGADRSNQPGKGAAILQQLLPQLLELPQLQVLAFGAPGPSHPKLVHCGFQSGEAAMARVFACGDCFLNPVTVEGFGQTMLEAAASGCVPLGLRGSGVEDAVRHGRSGLLLPGPEQLLAAIGDLRNEPERCRVLAAEARELIVQNHSLERQYHRWVGELTRHWAAPGPAPSAATPTAPAPKVSVVTTTLNCAEPLAATASSLAMQRGFPIEWVVQDGGSSDDTEGVVRQTAGHVQVRWQQAADQGIYDAANRAIARCRGEWLLFIQAGDWLTGPDAIARVLGSVQADVADLIVARFYELLIDGTLIERHPANPAQKLQSLRDGSFCRPGPHWLGAMPSHQAMLLRRSWCERFPFDTSYHVSADFQQMFSVVTAGARVAMSDQVVCWYPNGGFSFDHSHLMIEDQIRIAQHYQNDQGAVDAYFTPVLLDHQRSYQERRQRRRQLAQWYPG